METVKMTMPVGAPPQKTVRALQCHAPRIVTGASHAAAVRFTSTVSAMCEADGEITPGPDAVLTGVRFTVGPVVSAAAATAAVKVAWTPAALPRLLPSMDGLLRVEPSRMTPGDTDVTFVGSYTPPGGWPGRLADHMVGRHVTEATVHWWLQHVCRRLKAATTDVQVAAAPADVVT